jgi:hypothetical protein
VQCVLVRARGFLVFGSFEAAASAALGALATGLLVAPVGGITGGQDGGWTLRAGSALQPSGAGEVSFLARANEAVEFDAGAAAAAGAGGEAAPSAAAAAAAEAAWAGLAAWQATARMAPLPAGVRAEVFVMVRHPLKVVRSAQAAKWEFVFYGDFYEVRQAQRAGACLCALCVCNGVPGLRCSFAFCWVLCSLRNQVRVGGLLGHAAVGHPRLGVGAAQLCGGLEPLAGRVSSAPLVVRLQPARRSTAAGKASRG